MDVSEEDYLQLTAWVRRAYEINERNEKILAEFRIVIDTLLQILRARGQLNDGHIQVLDKLREKAHFVSEPKIELENTPDKYVVENSEVDCGARMHLCHGRCCSLNVRLSRQDLAEGQLAWRVDEPYFLAKNAEGYCRYQARETGFCGTYHNRPAACREFTCKGDRRIWLDFDAMIPAPMPEGLIQIRRNPRAASAEQRP